MDDKQRIALVETRTQGNDPSLPQLIRFQYSNHLGSACLELDSQAQIISYEEYYPFGSTSYQAVRSQTETAKRYRYTGKERDEESAFEYHRARHYLPWLGRWCNADPIGIDDGVNLYVYVGTDPIAKTDQNGKRAEGWGGPQTGFDRERGLTPENPVLLPTLTIIGNKDTNTPISDPHEGDKYQGMVYQEGLWMLETVAVKANAPSFWTKIGDAIKAEATRIKTAMNTISSVVTDFWSNSKFVFKLGGRVDVGVQGKAKIGLATVKADLVSFELLKGELDFAKMFDDSTYADDDDSVTGSYINEGGKGANVEQGLEAEVKLPVKGDWGLGGSFKHTFNTERPNSSSEVDYDFLIVVAVLKKQTDKMNKSVLGKTDLDALKPLDPGLSIKAKGGKKQDFYGIDLGVGLAVILGVDINLKLGFSR